MGKDGLELDVLDETGLEVDAAKYKALLDAFSAAIAAAMGE
jgi:hypothetical protein